MATAIAQDDDLLIIEDDSTVSEGNDNIEFSFDFGDEAPKKQEGTTSETLVTEKAVEAVDEIASPDLSALDMSLDLDIKEEISLESVAEGVTEEASQEVSLDLGMNFDTEITDEGQEETGEETVGAADFSLDLSETTETIPVVEEVVAATETLEVSHDESVGGDDTSMNAILSGTIAKLSARQEAIASDKAGKTSKEEELKAQIKELQSQVKDLESEMKALDSESEKITANITELENMKLDPVKVHNAKRVAKK